MIQSTGRPDDPVRHPGDPAMGALGRPMRGKPNDLVHITRLSRDGTRVYVRQGYQEGGRSVTASKAEAAVLTRAQAEMFIRRGRPDRRYRPQIEDI